MRPKDDPLRLDNFLCFAVYSTNLAFSRIYRPLLEPLGLTYLQYLALVALWDQDALLVGELGDRLFLTSSTLTPVIKRLEAIGFVQRARDKTDERQVRVRLTPRGRALKLRVCDVPHGILTASGLSTREIGALQDAMLALRRRLLEHAASDTVRSTSLAPSRAAPRPKPASKASKKVANRRVKRSAATAMTSPSR